MKRIAIHSVPRSGSTWLGEIFNSHHLVSYKYQPLFSYAFKDALNEDSSTADIVNFFDQINQSQDNFLNQTEQREQGKLPIFQKTEVTHQEKIVVYKEVRYHHILKNMLEKDSDLKVIGIIRSPLGTVNSWLKAPREFRADLGWKEDEEWRYAEKKNLGRKEEFNGYEKWKEVALLFKQLQREYPKQFMIIRYDDLIGKVEQSVKLLFEFCGMEITLNTQEFISSEKSSSDPYSVFKVSRADDGWMNGLSENIVKQIKIDLKGSELEEFLS